MKIAVAKEIEVGERRVALVPDVVGRLVKKGLSISVESGAGDRAFFSDGDYEAAGASIVADPQTLWGKQMCCSKWHRPKFGKMGNQKLAP